MNSQAEPPQRTGITSPQKRWRRLSVAAVVLTAVAVAGIGTVAAEHRSEMAASSAAKLQMGAARQEADSCDFSVTLTLGSAAREAASEIAVRSDATVDHDGVEVSIVRDQGRITMGATIDGDAHVAVTANAVQRAEVLAFMIAAIDHGDSAFDENEDLIAEFGGTDCDLLSAFDDNATLYDLIDRDVTLSFTTDDGDCALSTVVAPGHGVEEKPRDLDDLDLDDFDWDDVDLDDLDFGTDGDGFSIGLRTDHGEIRLECSDVN